MESEGEWTHIVTGGPWWPRKGHRCRVLTADDTPDFPASSYPWKGLGSDEVVVLIENDPLDREPDDEFGIDSKEDGWSCAIGRDDISLLTEV